MKPRSTYLTFKNSRSHGGEYVDVVFLVHTSDSEKHTVPVFWVEI